MIQRGERFEVIVTDMMMPELNGKDLYERIALHACDQSARVIFMTGGVSSDAERAFLLAAENPTLEKPFDRDALLAAVETRLAI